MFLFLFFFARKIEAKEIKRPIGANIYQCKTLKKMLFYALQKLFLCEQQGSDLISRKK